MLCRGVSFACDTRRRFPRRRVCWDSMKINRKHNRIDITLRARRASGNSHRDESNDLKTNLGLIETNRKHFLIIEEKKLTNYLAQIV